MSTAASVKNDIAAIRRGIESARNRRNELVESLRSIREQQNKLESAPLNRADFEAQLIADIEAQQAEALIGDDLLSGLEYSRTRSIKECMSGNAPSFSPFTDLHFSRAVVNKLLVAIGDPAAIIKRLKPALDRLDWKNCGPALAERKLQLADLAAKIGVIQSEIGEIEDLLDNADPREVTAAPGPKIGDRRCFDGDWAEWKVLVAGTSPGWCFDSTPHSGPAPLPITRYS